MAADAPAIGWLATTSDERLNLIRRTEVHHPEDSHPSNFKPNTGWESIAAEDVEEEAVEMLNYNLDFMPRRRTQEL